MSHAIDRHVCGVVLISQSVGPQPLVACSCRRSLSEPSSDRSPERRHEGGEAWQSRGGNISGSRRGSVGGPALGAQHPGTPPSFAIASRTRFWFRVRSFVRLLIFYGSAGSDRRPQAPWASGESFVPVFGFGGLVGVSLVSWLLFVRFLVFVPCSHVFASRPRPPACVGVNPPPTIKIQINNGPKGG